MKASYVTSCYRYENPQAGRLREFHSSGWNASARPRPQADAEVIALAHTVLETLGVTGVSLHINSIGCPACRAKYHEALKAYFSARKDQLCETCLGRLERNPMRILDCKSPVCSALAAEAPVILDYLCDDCAAHFQAVKGCLEEAELPYTVDPASSRGWIIIPVRYSNSFPTRWVPRQWCAAADGDDGLCQELGGPSIPSLGFGMGLERLLLVMEAKGCAFPAPPQCELYLGSYGRGRRPPLLRHRLPPAGGRRGGGIRRRRPGAESPDEIRG